MAAVIDLEQIIGFLPTSRHDRADPTKSIVSLDYLSFALAWRQYARSLKFTFDLCRSARLDSDVKVLDNAQSLHQNT
ncbi:hypothetical protein [Chamaesiphon sp. VAR_48_metabat_403]|uniref:hypothetical protein n=1 Tax=Chamaesiphon sp. VAR_48_metabat_403 TaxID=2964700 RepID=UPI00286E1A3B|nr:hypothetical protein [Chamaesiphon sp. VAR_48_metabat_403]